MFFGVENSIFLKYVLFYLWKTPIIYPEEDEGNPWKTS